MVFFFLVALATGVFAQEVAVTTKQAPVEQKLGERNQEKEV